MTNARKNALLVAAEPDMTGRGLEPAHHSDGARILYLVGCIAAIYGAYLSAQWAVTTAGIPIDLTAGSGVGEVLFLVIILVCCYLFTRYVWGQSVSGFFLAYVHAWRKTLRGFAVCAGLTFVVALTWFVFIFAIGGAQWSSAAWAEVDWNTLRVVLRRSLVAIVLASTEELVFRGIAFKYLIGAGGRVAVVRAIVVSSVIFSLSHHFQDPEYWLDVGAIGLFVGLFLIGVLLCLVYYVTNSLACAIGVHSGLIWFAVLKKTEVLQLIPSGWTVSNAFDPRAQPATWLLFVLLSVVIFGLRHRLHRAFAVESLDPSAPWATRNQPATRRERAFVFGGVAACIVAVLAVQAQTDWSRRQSGFAKYQTAVAGFEAAAAGNVDIEAAARDAKFHPASDIRLGVKEFKRRPDGKVEIGGWAGTPVGDGTPLILFVLAGGKTVLHVETAGTDPDAAQVLALTDAGASNIKFAGSFACTAGEPIRIVTTTSRRTYSVQFRPCP